jgi:phosphatidylglycerophosphate synthase
LGEQFPADALGKVKMLTQCFAVGIVLGMFAFAWSPQWMEVLGALAQIFVWSTVVTSVGSGVNYVLKTRRILAGHAG